MAVGMRWGAPTRDPRIGSRATTRVSGEPSEQVVPVIATRIMAGRRFTTGGRESHAFRGTDPTPHVSDLEVP